jgi:hypothetical protein
MNDETKKPEDFGSLYRRAFAEYGTQALWNMRPIEDPTPAPATVLSSDGNWNSPISAAPLDATSTVFFYINVTLAA